MTPDLDELERLLAAATPGPWRVDPGPKEDPTDYVIYGGSPPPDEQWVANLNPDPNTTLTGVSFGTNTGLIRSPAPGMAELMKWENAALIVAAINALPALIAAARQALPDGWGRIDFPPGNYDLGGDR